MKEIRIKPHFHVTAGLIRRDGKLLITKRPPGSHLAGFWEFPGGKKEKGETLKECLEREIEEELSVRITAEKPLFTVNHEYENRAITLYLFQCSQLSGEPMPVECEEIRWVCPEDLPKYTFPPPDRRIIEFLILHGGGGETIKRNK